MEIFTKPVCEYGANCYRKNPKHLKEYSHPKETVREKKKQTEEKHVSKKPKLDIVKQPAKRPMLDIVKEPVKKSPVNEKKTEVKTPDTGKKLKQTTLNFFKKKDDVKKSPTRTSPRKQAQEEVKNSPKKMKSPKKLNKDNVKTSVDCINEKDEEKPVISPVLLERSKKDPAKKKLVESPKKNEKKASPVKAKAIHNLSDSEDETPELTEMQIKEFEKEFDENFSEPTPEASSKTIIEESDNDDEEEKEEKPKTSWTYIKKAPEAPSGNTSGSEKSNSREDIIKNLFLVEMPQDFYSFYEFCKELDSSQPLKALKICGLKLVGPFDILGDNKKLIERDNAVCHWRYYYDPPEFQTVLSGEKGFHLGYWRDDPKEPPVFVASNDSNDCVFKIESENLFGALQVYLTSFAKSCDPFGKLKISKLQTSLNKWAEEHNFTLGKSTDAMRRRQRRTVAKTFHKVGIVVPYDPKTELGYRPLIETEANLRKICKLIMDNPDQSALWDNLQPLITAANIANDECDFGNSLELGIDLFCMGSPIFHDTIENLLTISYSLLNRSEFAEIIKAHLKNRKKGTYLSLV